jgi:flagellin-like protein
MNNVHMKRKGVSNIIAAILLILIVLSSAAIIYSSISSYVIPPSPQYTNILESIKIVQVSLEEDYLRIYVINRGGINATIDSVYIEDINGKLITRYSVYYEIPANEEATITIPKGDIDLTKPYIFKLASQRGTLTSYLTLVQLSMILPTPRLFTYYPLSYVISTGSYIGGSLPDSVEYIDDNYFSMNSSPSIVGINYYPSGYTVHYGSYVNGSIELLQNQDYQSMFFLSQPYSQINRTYFSSNYNIINGSLLSGSISDTYYLDNNRMSFSASKFVSSVYYPISNMNFTYNASNWYGYTSEFSPTILSSTVTFKSSGLVSANQRAITRTNDPNKTIHVVYSNGTYLGYSLSVDNGITFVDQWFISNGSGYELGYNPSMASDINNNIHITYQNDSVSPRAIKYILFSYNSSYGGNPRTSTSYQIIDSSGKWATHFIAMSSNISQLSLYIRNASTSSSILQVEIRKVFTNGTPDMSSSGLIANTTLTNIPTSFTWVNVSINANLTKGSQYSIVLSTNGIFHWAYTSTSYIGSLGGWYYTTSWTIYPATHFCFMIPGWYGWISSTPITIYSASGVTVQRPVIALYPYLTSLDQSFYSTDVSSSVYGNYYYAQSFKPSSSVLSGIMLYLYRVGSPSDHLYIEIRKSNGSYPDMSSSGIITSGRIDFGRVNDVTSAQWYDCIFKQLAYLNTSETYWIVVYSTNSTSSNCWAWYRSPSDSYANGTAAYSNNGGNTWNILPYDFSFRTYSSKDERPAIAWYYQAPSGTNRLKVLFLRCLPNYDPSLISSWYDYTGTGTTPNTIYQVSVTAETRISMTIQPNTNNIYIFFIRRDNSNLYYNRIYRWNPDTGSWGAINSTSAITIASGVNFDELSSAPEFYNNWVIFATTYSSTGYSFIRYFTSSNTQIDISPSSTSMRFPTITCINDRIYVIYQNPSGIYYRYYNGTWSGEFLYYNGTSFSLPNSICRPLASSIDFIWLNSTNQILYGSIYPIGLLKIIGPDYDPSNGNPYGSAGGCFKCEIDDKYFDYSFYRMNITFYTNFTSPLSWDEVKASFSWKFELLPSQAYNYGNFSNVKLNSVKLILADNYGNDIAILYSDDNNGSGWIGTSIGYLYRNDIIVNYSFSPNTLYILKIVFDISCSEASNVFHIIARIDDVGLSFIKYSSIISIEFYGISDTDDWASICIDTVFNASNIPYNVTIRAYNFNLNRYAEYGENGYFNFTISTLDEIYKSLKITSNINDFRNSIGNWQLLINIESTTSAINFSLNMLNFIPQVNIHSIIVEFNGVSDTNYWNSLIWRSTQAFSESSVNVTIQLYNYAIGSYSTYGDGYYNYTSGPSYSYESISQEITNTPQNFRDSSGNWKILITATKLGKQFYMLNDYILFNPIEISQQIIDCYFIFSEINGTIINATYTITYKSSSSVNITIQLWDYSISSWTTFYSGISTPNIPQTISFTLTSNLDKYIRGETRFRIYTYSNQSDYYDFNIDQLKLDLFAI